MVRKRLDRAKWLSLTYCQEYDWRCFQRGPLARAMVRYLCLFFKDGIVAYWENIDAEADSCIRAVLMAMLTTKEWEAAEAWRGEVLVCRIEAAPNSGFEVI